MQTTETQRNGLRPEAGGAVRNRRGRRATGPHPVDVHVGSRLRLRRMMLGLSQSRLGESVGLTFQQIQKYERGANRMGASRLFELASVLDVPISYLFAEMPTGIANEFTGASTARVGSRSAMPAPTDIAGMRLVSAYRRIDDQRLKRAVYDLMQSVSGRKTGH